MAPIAPVRGVAGTPRAGAPARWIPRLREAVEDFDWLQTTALTQDYVAYLHAAPERAAVPEAKEMLRVLRENRRYDDLLAVADALLTHRLMDPWVKRAVAQALVDRDRPAAALLVFESILQGPQPGSAETDEALGGIGRCTKEMYLRTTDPADRAAYLARSYQAYRGAYDRDARNIWHGINAAALLDRAARDGATSTADVPLPDDPVAEAHQLAAGLLVTVRDAAEPDAWQLATGCEACVALGEDDEAVSWASLLVEGGRASPFQLAALLRQLTVVWQLDTRTPPGDRLLPLLRAELLRHRGGDVVVDAAELREERLDPASESSLEKVFGDTRFVGLPWYRNGLERCRAVARIETESADGIGTGFLVQGPALHPDLPPVVLVTNAHVVPEGMDPRDAFVAFHGLDHDAATVEPRRFTVSALLWSEASTAPGLDTSILTLHHTPPGITLPPVAEDLPRLRGGTSQRAYLIGHPRGLETPQYSMQDNAILDYDEVLLHYRSPTEPGSSGSPVFDDQWRLIGLHHAGRGDTPRLHNQGGTYAANEAILIRAIRRRLAERPPQAQ